MMWFWLNIPLAIVMIGLVAGVPLWAVLRHFDWVFAQPGPDPQPSQGRQPADPYPTEHSRQLDGAQRRP